MSPQNTLLWQMGYFKLKALENQQMQDEHFIFPFFSWKKKTSHYKLSYVIWDKPYYFLKNANIQNLFPKYQEYEYPIIIKKLNM